MTDDLATGGASAHDPIIVTVDGEPPVEEKPAEPAEEETT